MPLQFNAAFKCQCESCLLLLLLLLLLDLAPLLLFGQIVCIGNKKVFPAPKARVLPPPSTGKGEVMSGTTGAGTKVHRPLQDRWEEERGMQQLNLNEKSI